MLLAELGPSPMPQRLQAVLNVGAFFMSVLAADFGALRLSRLIANGRCSLVPLKLVVNSLLVKAVLLGAEALFGEDSL